MKKGFLALTLNAHSPFAGNSDEKDVRTRLFMAITDVYMPLLLCLDNLCTNKINFQLNLVLSPILIQNLLNTELMAQYKVYLEATVSKIQEEMSVNKDNEELSKVANKYYENYQTILSAFTNKYNCNLINEFKKHQANGNIEILASAATHAFLPLFSDEKETLKAQIETGIRVYKNVFDTEPVGFWLPECGYSTQIEQFLVNNNIRYTILNDHGIIFGNPAPIYGTYSSVVSKRGLAFFGRDHEASNELWNSESGFSSDGIYKEQTAANNANTFTLSYKSKNKSIYNYENAQKKVQEHAAAFIEGRENQINYISDYMNKAPVITLPIDAEFLGMDWFEGMDWLENVLILADKNSLNYSFITFSEYINNYPVMQLSAPCSSSWSYNGYNEFFLNSNNDWIYKHLHIGDFKMAELANTFNEAEGLLKSALNQAAREILLAESSDMAFSMNSETERNAANERITKHLNRFFRLYDDIKKSKLNETWLKSIMKEDNIFPEINYKTFALKA